jgi:UDP-3-O-[3-hydroxymyristoyl] glucosamine N-acyltransferase
MDHLGNAMEYTVAQLAEILLPTAVRGSYSGKIYGIASLEEAGPGNVSFFYKPSYLRNSRQFSSISNCRASVLLLPTDFPGEPGEGRIYFLLPDPSLAVATLCAAEEKTLEISAIAGVHPTAIISPTAFIDPTASIGPYCTVDTGTTIAAHVHLGSHCTIGPRCQIGDHVRLHDRVTLYRDTAIGSRSIVHSGAVIGCDGYGYASGNDGIHRKLPHIGRVIIGEDVEIGANTTIDRARFAITRIGSGTKIDNLVQIGHNVTTGRSCLIVAQAGIAGSTTLGDHVVLAGQSGIAGHISIGDRTQVGAQGGVDRNLPADCRVRGTPSMAIDQANRFYVLRKDVPELFRRVTRLERNRKDVGRESPPPSTAGGGLS